MPTLYNRYRLKYGIDVKTIDQEQLTKDVVKYKELISNEETKTSSIRKFESIIFKKTEVIFISFLKARHSHISIEERKDIVDIALFRILKNIHKYDESKSRFATWAIWQLRATISKVVHRVYIQKNAPHVNNVYLDDEDTANYLTEFIDDSKNREPETVMKEMIKELGYNHLYEFIYNGKKISEIAAEFDMNENTVKTHVFRQKKNLAKHVKKTRPDLLNSY